MRFRVLGRIRNLMFILFRSSKTVEYDSDIFICINIYSETMNFSYDD